MESTSVVSPLRDAGSRVVVAETAERGSRDLACRHLAGVTRLLASRGDLRGVHAWADIVDEALRWSA